MTVDGRATAVAGGLWHAGDPSIAWFWPAVVVIACVLAVWRLHRAELDERLARVLGFAALAGVTVGGVARQLHGRPAVSAFQVVGLALILAFVGWALSRMVLRRPGYFFYLVVGCGGAVAGRRAVPDAAGRVRAGGGPGVRRPGRGRGLPGHRHRVAGDRVRDVATPRRGRGRRARRVATTIASSMTSVPGGSRSEADRGGVALTCAVALWVVVRVRNRRARPRGSLATCCSRRGRSVAAHGSIRRPADR